MTTLFLFFVVSYMLVGYEHSFQTDHLQEQQLRATIPKHVQVSINSIMAQSVCVAAVIAKIRNVEKKNAALYNGSVNGFAEA